MISAKEARGISGNGKEADMLVLDKLIRAAAENGECKIRVPYEMTAHRGYEQWFKSAGLLQDLIELGYKVESKSEDRQFVDLWMEVSW